MIKTVRYFQFEQLKMIEVQLVHSFPPALQITHN